MLSLNRGRDMVMPRRYGGFYKIGSPDVDGPNSLVTISTYCDELSSASYIL
jgi:predicted phage tail protein